MDFGRTFTDRIVGYSQIMNRFVITRRVLYFHGEMQSIEIKLGSMKILAMSEIDFR